MTQLLELASTTCGHPGSATLNKGGKANSGVKQKCKCLSDTLNSRGSASSNDHVFILLRASRKLFQSVCCCVVQLWLV